MYQGKRNRNTSQLWHGLLCVGIQSIGTILSIFCFFAQESYTHLVSLTRRFMNNFQETHQTSQGDCFLWFLYRACGQPQRGFWCLSVCLSVHSIPSGNEVERSNPLLCATSRNGVALQWFHTAGWPTYVPWFPGGSTSPFSKGWVM